MPIRRIASSAALLTIAVLTIGTLASLAHADWTSVDGQAIAVGPNYQYAPATQSDGVGGAYMAWLESIGGPVRITRLRRDGAAAPGWVANGMLVRADKPTTGFPALLADGPDGIFVTYQSLPSPILDTVELYVQRFQGNGKVAPGWPQEGIDVGPPLGAGGVPILVADGRGGAFALWVNTSDEPAETRLWAQHLDAHGRVLWGATPRVLVRQGRTFTFDAVSDEHGGLLIAFESRDPQASRALRLDADGSPHPGWDPAGLRLTETPDPSSARVVADGAGGGFFAWTTNSIGQTILDSRDVYAQHLRADGSFDGPNVPLATQPRQQSIWRTVTDDAGGAIFFWSDFRPGSLGFDIAGQRLNASGQSLWTPGGVTIVRVAGSELITDAVADGSSGAFLVWIDQRAGFEQQDLAMSRITADGTPASGWPADGIVVSAAEGLQDHGRIAYHAPFDPIVVWSSSPSPIAYTSDVFAERVSADGAGVTAAGTAHGLQKATAGALASTAIAPGVVASGTTLELSLPSAGATQIVLFDLGGRRVASQEAGFLGAGSHTIELRVAPSLRSGLYFVQVSQAGRSWTTRLSLMR